MPDNISHTAMLKKAMGRPRSKDTIEMAVENAVVDSADDSLDYHAEEIRKIAGLVGAAIIEIGRRLVECKKLVPHGDWGAWLEMEFEWSDKTAQRYMQVFTRFASNSSRVSDLPARTLYLLAAPNAPADAVEAILTEAEKTGVRPKFDDVRIALARAKALAFTSKIERLEAIREEIIYLAPTTERADEALNLIKSEIGILIEEIEKIAAEWSH